MESARQISGKREAVFEPLDGTVDHIRGPHGATTILDYGDYERPYSRQAYRAIERVEAQLGDSSPHRHASAHARGSGHPVACSAEPGEEWSWCYLDEVAFLVGTRDGERS